MVREPQPEGGDEISEIKTRELLDFKRKLIGWVLLSIMNPFSSCLLFFLGGSL